LIYRSHGLSYSKFTLSNLQLSEVVVLGGAFKMAVSLTVENMGLVTGSEVIQVYISLPATSKLTHPLLQLKGFAMVRDLIRGNKERLEVVLDKYAVSYWNVIINAWTVRREFIGLKLVRVVTVFLWQRPLK
jgi:beta-glucosidase